MNEMNGYNIVFRHDFPRDYVILCASFFESDLTDSFAVFSLLTVADNMLKERKCEMKGTGKRILSVSLSVMMALGMPSGTFAATPDEAAAGQVSEAEVPAAEPEVTQEVSPQATEEPKAEEKVDEAKKITPEVGKTESIPEEKKTEEKDEKSETEDSLDSGSDSVEDDKKELPDIKVTKTELIETENECLVTVYTDSNIYNQLYVGKKEDTDKTPVVEGKKDLNGYYSFQFAVSENQLGTELQVVPGIKESGEWYLKEDVFCKIPEKTDKQEEKSEQKSEQKAKEKEQISENNGIPQGAAEDTADVAIKTVYATDQANGDRAGKDFPMFKISKSTARINGNNIDISIYVSPASSGKFTYDALYIGRWDDETKEPLIMGEEDSNLKLEKFSFSVPIEKNGQEVIFVPRRASNKTFSTSKIALKLPNLKGDGETTGEKPGTTIEPTIANGTKVENSIVAKKSDGKVFSMFNVERSTATVNGDHIDIVLYLKANASGKFTYSSIYLGSKEDADKTPTIAGSVNKDNKQVYEFSIPISKVGTNLQFVPIKENGSIYDKADLYLTIPTFKKDEGTSEPSITPEPSTAPDQTVVTPSDSTKPQVIKENAEEFKMFIISSFETKTSGDKILLTIRTENSSFDRLYLGKNDDLNKTPVINGSKDGKEWTFQITVDKTQAGKAIPVVLGKTDGTWYSNMQLYLVIPTVKDSGANNLEKADVVVEQGGTAAPVNGFKVVSSSAKLNGEQISVSFTVDGILYDRIYLGKKDDSKKEPAVKGVQNNNQTTFTFQVAAEKQGINIPITLGRTNGAWLTSGRNLFIRIPNIGKKFDSQTYPNGIYDAYGNIHTGNGVFNIESDSTITVKGDEITVTLYSGSTSYDKLFIGDVGEDETVKDNNAVEGKLLGESDPERPEYRVYTFTLKKSQLGTKVPFVLHSCKGNDKWLTKQDYLEIPKFMTKVGDVVEELTYRKANIINNANDFIINADKSYYMIRSGALGRVVIATDSDAYNRLYFGTRAEINEMIKNGNGGSYLPLWKLSNGSYGYIWDGFSTEITNKRVSYVLYSTKTGKWSEGTYHMNIPATESMTEACNDVGTGTDLVERTDDIYANPKAPDTEVKPSTTPANVPSDGYYTTTSETGAAMFRVIDTKLTVKNGKINAEITLSGIGYDYLYMGTAEKASEHKDQWIKYFGTVQYIENGENKTGRKYIIPISALDTPLTMASRSEKKEKWYNRTITVSSKNLKKTGELPAEGTPEDGIYSTTAETGAAMFKVIAVTLTVKNGKMTALVTLSGIGYDYLYVGTAAEAAKHQNQWIKYNGTSKYTLNGTTKTGRTYELPVSALDQGIKIASHSESHNKWYDRTITFSSKDLKKIGNISGGSQGNGGNSGIIINTSGNGNGGNNSSTGSDSESEKVDTKPDSESKYESDTSGSTTKVDNKTKMKDGVYTPDKFTWSGGTGKVSITCDKVTIKNGQALATIAFSSSAYQYVKANGRKYLPTHTGGKSIFVIPVELNKNNKIIGMTTKMSAAHEIEYSIMVYLAAADGDGSGAAAGDGSGMNFGSKDKLDEKAPDIIGLKYKSETKLDYADYFKIYHYDDDITLLEIDLSKDTDKDPEKLEKDAEAKDTADADNKKDTKKTGKSGKKKVAKITIKRNDEEKKNTDTQSVAYNDEGEAVVQTQEEITADLYKAKVVKYLIVPEDSDAELPVGIEKEMIVVKLPIKHAYVDSEESVNTLETLKLLKKVKAVGFDKDETDIDAVNKGLEEDKMVYAGAADDLKFRELVKNKIDFAIVSSEVLPGSKTAEDAKEKDSDTDSKKNSDSKNQKKADVKDADDKSTDTDSKKTTDSSDENEEEAVLDQLADNFATLGIPMLIDRSADEESDLGKAEWLKVYGAFFGCSDKTDKLYDKAVKAAKSKK